MTAQNGDSMPESRGVQATSLAGVTCDDGTVRRIDGWNDYRNVPTLTWRVAYKGHLLGNASDEAEGWRWVEDMRRMEAAGEYDPARAERDRLAHQEGR